ncbi:TIGR03016 family PEP-CTERM system-associated outer membrane protein [Thalassotalea atypica]|uniref:TIGR03016 family PEP-CTERM system-associated outer membrane protein n=1 Tax=Thalassotalea atypica TaxID=2054316 RepID=UPI002573A8F8|nr:TIGR03016 family PEP-CTERM system-associated outer membrane protein [Thalassotalea atypica]
MAITAMDMAIKDNKFSFLALLLSFSSCQVLSADLEITPSVTLGTTYTDNVLAEKSGKTDSLVSEVGAAISASLESRALTVSLQSSIERKLYSNDHDLDKNFTFLNSQLSFSPWANGPELQLSASINNVAKSTADNLYSDLVSGETVQTENYTVGLSQVVNNSNLQLNASVNANKSVAEDNVGESEGYQSSFSFSNGSGIKRFFWDIYGNYSDRENNGRTGRNHKIDVKLGFSTPIKLSPYIRYYDEDFSGNISTSQNNLTTPSSGAGIRWQVAEHFVLDTSYNYVDDSRVNDDYIEATINWQASERTSIYAKYNQRFFGDSFNVNISHRNRRLTNNITYDETLQAFQRDNFEVFISGSIWCPINQPFDESNCLSSNENIADPSEYVQLNTLAQRPIEDDQFSLNKSLQWSSELALSKTTFTLTASRRERENLSQGNIDKYFNSSLVATRSLSSRSNISLTWRFNKVEYNTNSIEDAFIQTDYYRMIKTIYNRKLTNELSGDISLEYRNRTSDRNDRDYEESRIAINIKKDF